MSFTILLKAFSLMFMSQVDISHCNICLPSFNIICMFITCAMFSLNCTFNHHISPPSLFHPRLHLPVPSPHTVFSPFFSSKSSIYVFDFASSQAQYNCLPFPQIIIQLQICQPQLILVYAIPKSIPLRVIHHFHSISSWILLH